MLVENKRVGWRAERLPSVTLCPGVGVLRSGVNAGNVGETNAARDGVEAEAARAAVGTVERDAKNASVALECAGGGPENLS